MDVPQTLEQGEVHDCDLPAFEGPGTPNRVMNYLLLGPRTIPPEQNLTEFGELARPNWRH